MEKNNQDINIGTKKNVFKRKLGRTVLFWFLTLSLVPLTIISIVSYFQAYKNLRDAAINSISSTANLKTSFIDNWYAYRLKDLKSQSMDPTNITFLKELRKVYRASGKDLADFVGNEEWVDLVDTFGGDLINFQRHYGYYDVFLIDDDGNILFSVAQEGDLGTNLKTGIYSKTKFARAYMETIETLKPVFSDLEFYAPSAYGLAGFIAQAMDDEKGDTIGTMAFQMELDKINLLMQDRTGLGKTGETYLIGSDFLLRTAPAPGEQSSILNEGLKVSNELSREWYYQYFSQKGSLKVNKEKGPSEKSRYSFSEAREYINHKGIQVIGLINHLEVAGVPMAVVAEIESGEAFASFYRLRIIVAILATATSLFVIVIAFFISRRIVRPIQKLHAVTRLAAGGELDHKIEIKSKNEIGELADSFNTMLHNLRETRDKSEASDWFKTGQTELNNRMRGDLNIEILCENVINYLADYLNVQMGALYVTAENKPLKLISTYAYNRRKQLSNEFMPGEGLVGQAAVEKKYILITDCPVDYVSIYSGLGESAPKNILVYPLLMEDSVKGVIELGTFYEFSDTDIAFLEQVSGGIAIAINTVESQKHTIELLEKTQVQAEELQAQQEELKTTNEELEFQANTLKESEERLQAQQEELRATNEELEEKTQRLEDQKQDIEIKNRELEIVQEVVEEKAKDLEMSSKYKSEFLANMSHELRTPLNSILLLSRYLGDNKDGKLSEDHVESALSIHSSGTDLLNLINEVLDISKVEAGKMELHIDDMDISDFMTTMKRNFKPIATEKKLSLNFEIEEGMPKYINTDRQRVEQIVKNFLSNSIKFTSKGEIALRIGRPNCLKMTEDTLLNKGFDPAKTIALSVSDTGIGIPEDKQKLIFEAFQQADGTTSRKYGGTGLGLSIAREFAILLKGEVCMHSTPGIGSTFVLCLPEAFDSKAESKEIQPKEVPAKIKKEAGPASPPAVTVITDQEKDAEPIDDDRKNTTPEDKSILLIEDDITFLKILRDLSREHGFKCLVAEDGETGLQFADYYKPSAIIMDVGLPGINGWTVMARLKENPALRHIPVHFISAADRKLDAMKMGAVDYLVKPVSPEALENVYEKLEKMIAKQTKELLVVEDNEEQAKVITKMIGNGDVHITIASTAKEAYDQIITGKYDCMILDLGLPDMSGIDLLKKIRNYEETEHIPIVIYTGRELSHREKSVISEYAESIIVKGVDSYQKLLDETTLFLHRVNANLPEKQRKMIMMSHDKEERLLNKNILVVDDDMRNVFSLKKILEEKGIRVFAGKNGIECLECLKNKPDIDLVLLDIMMPEMDGYEAMGKIRKQEQFKNLPIIALTAKAMKGDRSKCIEAGASDYLAKPVDIDRLFSMLRVWLY